MEMLVQAVLNELIALMPNAVNRPNEGQMVIRELRTWDDLEAARVTLKRFGHRAISFHVAPDHVTFIRMSGVSSPASNALHIEFDEETGRVPVAFYNDLPENMRGWMDRSSDGIGSDTVVAARNTSVDFVDFVEELRRNNVRLALFNGNIDRYRERPSSRWAIPVYDFGGLLQPNMDDFLGDELIDQLLEAAPSGPEPLTPECVFLHRYRLGKEIDPSGEVLATTLIRVEGLTESGEPNVTFAAQHQTRRLRGDGHWGSGYWQTMEPKLAAAEPELARWHCRWAMESVRLLAGWRECIELREVHSPLIKRVNAKRKMLRQAPVPETKLVHICAPRVQYVRPTDPARIYSQGQFPNATHASPQPHTRTICEREITYERNGKEVRYRFKKAGQRIVVQPRGQTRLDCFGPRGATYQVVQ